MIWAQQHSFFVLRDKETGVDTSLDRKLNQIYLKLKSLKSNKKHFKTGYSFHDSILKALIEHLQISLSNLKVYVIYVWSDSTNALILIFYKQCIFDYAFRI